MLDTVRAKIILSFLGDSEGSNVHISIACWPLGFIRHSISHPQCSPDDWKKFVDLLVSGMHSVGPGYPTSQSVPLEERTGATPGLCISVNSKYSGDGGLKLLKNIEEGEISLHRWEIFFRGH